MDDTGRLLERINYRALEARRDQVTTPASERNDERERFLQLIHDLTAILRPGTWIKKRRIAEICKQYRTGLDLVSEILGIAESDNGEYLCWPTEETPEIPPN